MRPTYNPYTYKNPYYYKKYNQNNAKRIERLNKLRKLNRLTNWSNNTFNNGSLTGYSLPINQNSYNRIFSTQNSPSYNSLFYDPTGNKSFYKYGKFFTQNKDINGSTGVKIIYD